MKVTLPTDVTLSYDIYGPEDGPRGRPRTRTAPGVPVRDHAGAAADEGGIPRRHLRPAGGSAPPRRRPPPPYTVELLGQDLAALNEALELGRCTYIGYSVGAMILLELAMKRPELIERAALIGGFRGSPASCSRPSRRRRWTG